MKKKSLLLLSLIMVFTASFSYAASPEEDLNYQDLLNDLEILEDSLLDEELHPDFEASIEELLEAEKEALEEVENLEEMKESMEEMSPQLRSFAFTDFIEDLYNEAVNRLMEIREAIERQYNGKKQLIVNSKESYQLSLNINKEIKAAKDELINIIKDEDRRIDVDSYRELLILTDRLKSELNENNYMLGQIARSSKKYVESVAKKDFRGAMEEFDKILSLQEEKLDLLRTIDRNIHDLNLILAHA